MKKVSEAKITRVRVADRADPHQAEVNNRVRVVRVTGPASRAARWYVSRPIPKD